jgi:hypothetical protein
MLIGNRSEFAIEYHLDADFGGVWLFGKVCYWINGRRIGSFELGTSLRDVLTQVHSLLKDSGKRHIGLRSKWASEEVFDELDNALYGIDDTQGIFLDSPARFDVRIPVDVFDEWKIYLFEESGFDYFLYKNDGVAGVNCFELKIGVFDSVIAAFYAELNSIYEQQLEQGK